MFVDSDNPPPTPIDNGLIDQSEHQTEAVIYDADYLESWPVPLKVYYDANFGGLCRAVLKSCQF